jgi:hypothetical protein
MVYFATYSNEGEIPDIIIRFMLILVPIGTVAFAIVMYLGAKVGVMDLHDTEVTGAVNAEKISMDKLAITNEIDKQSA